MTYSLVARDARTGELGVAVHSHWFGVGSIVPRLRAGVGAVATQSVPDPVQGAKVLELFERGAPPDEAIDAVLRGDEGGAYRQIAAVDATGRVAVHTGHGCIADAGHVTGDGWSAQGNMMSSAEVWPAMGEAFTAAGPDEGLAERLVIALEAADAAGGDVRGRQSAALLVVPPDGEPWQFRIDLRVDDHPDPVAELRRLLSLQRAYDLAGQADELMGEGRAAEAAPRYVRAAELAPESDELLFWAGLALAHTGDLAAGVDAVRRAAARHPGWLDLLDRLSPDFAPAGAAVRRALGR
jgi:uncharacterized Ntn-hydrolase superfamily protein